jgi:hypothetical protein
MSKTADLEARAARLGKRQEEEQPAAHKPPAPRAKPVALTLPLSPELYRAVKAYPEEMHLPELTGRARIATADVFRALAEELAENPELREHVATRLRANLST